MAWDSQGRLFFSSDSTGEIYVVVRKDDERADGSSPTSGLPSTPTGSAPSNTRTPNAAVGMTVSMFAAVWAGIVAMPLI